MKKVAMWQVCEQMLMTYKEGMAQADRLMAQTMDDIRQNEEIFLMGELIAFWVIGVPYGYQIVVDSPLEVLRKEGDKFYHNRSRLMMKRPEDMIVVYPPED